MFHGLVLFVTSCSKSTKKADPEKLTESVGKESGVNEEKSEDLTLDEGDLEGADEEPLIGDEESGLTQSEEVLLKQIPS